MKTFDLRAFKENGGHVHFVGCAGAGTQPLASIFLDLGFPCSGSDLLETKQTDLLRTRGMHVCRGHRKENLPPEGTPLLVVHTSAAGIRNPELEEAHQRGIPVMRRGEALAHLGTLFPHTIAVAGSHGKTSVTSLIAHALKTLGYDPGYLIGGSVTGWKISGTAGGKSVFVTEVDESDSTNALFRAETAVVTNIEDDHSWSVGGVGPLFDSFVTFAKKADRLIYVPGTHTNELFRNLPDSILVPSSLPLRVSYPSAWGGFQRQNARTAFTALREFCGKTISDEEIASAIFSFPGVERRMSVRFDNADHATRILMENIVKPLKDEFNETKRELARNTREMARLRKAIDRANSCKYHDDCPVLGGLREQPKDGGCADGSAACGGGQLSAEDVGNGVGA